MGASSGLIIAFVVAVWAAYFVPLVLRRYDEASREATVELAGESGRVIATTARRPEPHAETSTQTAPESTEEVTTVNDQTEQAPVATTVPAPRRLDRPAARLAARRRRRTLLTLVALLVVTSGLALGGVVPRLAVVAPVVLIVAWLVACRIQVRGELGLSTPRVRMPKADKKKDVAEPVAKAMEDEDTVVISGQFEDVDPGRKHVMEQVELESDALDDKVVIAVPSVSTQGEALWDPLPITVPTYVTKPRAGRTVRTIDFSQPNTWTSGHIEGEDTELPQRRDAAAELDEGPRAVNG